jgi:threonine synthase
MNPALTGLRCLRCGTTHPPVPAAYDCPACRGQAGNAGILDAEWNYPALAGDFARAVNNSADATLHRFRALLPIDPDPGTPVSRSPLVEAPALAASLSIGRLLLKYEGANPSRCLKDRATALAIPLALAAGADTLYCASAGNAAISLATFARAAGLGCEVFVPGHLSEARQSLLAELGATVHLVPGVYDQAFAEAERAAARHGWYSRNCALNPWLVEGKKTVAFEIAEQLGWQPPDLVVAPVGDGCTLGATGKGFRELVTLGLLERVPRLLGVQAEAVSPLVALSRGGSAAGPWGATHAASIRVEQPRNATRLLAELAHAGGGMVAVEDDATAEAQGDLRALLPEGVEFTSATTLAGVRLLLAEELLPEGATVVLLVTSGREA